MVEFGAEEPLESAVVPVLGAELAAEGDLLDLNAAVERLRQTTFHVTPSLLKTLLDRHAERKRLEQPGRKS